MTTKKEPWDTPNPKKQHHTMTAPEKAKAKRSAKKAGRSKPSLVDNMNAIKK